ncbi:MAG: methyltransferase domain-containing protein [Kiritimatiellae bacterium]|nr:methyltransferase domain-containing protein [Kiritimatiellia bacterium]MDD5520810.1 methyltransferase domain-containing protein [Kiritimatiellia bacterium]
MDKQNSERNRDSSAISRVADILVCPKCSGQLKIKPDEILCLGCGSKYPIRGGVPLLARLGTSDTWSTDNGKSEISSKAYQEQYHDIVQAEDYNKAYKQKLFKRMSTAREYSILQRLLRSQGHCGVILDLPCGGGRLSPQIAPFTDLLVEADIAEGQVFYGKRNLSLNTPQIWMTASAFHIPFRNESFDGTVCCRLCHHLPTAKERQRLIKELLRVSKRFVIMTFFDYNSMKNMLRRIRQPFDHKAPKMTMTINEVRRQASENGAKLIASPALAFISSGHRYALMVKDNNRL